MIESGYKKLTTPEFHIF